MARHSRSAGAALLLVLGSSAASVPDQSLLVQVQKQLRFEQLRVESPCPAGYEEVHGDVAGWDHFGRGMSNKKATAELCADDCSQREECLSFEWGPTTNICSLNKKAMPGMKPFEDYIFCKRLTFSPTDAGAADPGYGGFVFHEIETTMPPAWHVELGQCSLEGRCVASWGSDMDVLLETRMESRIEHGDTIGGAIKFNIVPQNLSNPLTKLFPKPMTAESKCSVCIGSCSLDANSENMELSLVIPTFVDDISLCNSTDSSLLTKINQTILNKTVVLPDLKELQLEGNLTVSSVVTSANGDLKSEDSFGFFMHSRDAEPASLSRRQRSKRPRNLPSTLWYMYKKTVAQAAKTVAAKSAEAVHLSATSKKLKTTTRGPMDHAINLNVTVQEVEAGRGQNFSFSSRDICNSTDANGSFACAIPMQGNASHDVSLLLDLEMDLEEGSKLNLTVMPHIGGVMGPLFANMLPSMAQELPLCGPSILLNAFGEVSEYDPPKCGFYKIFVKTLIQELFSSKDLAGIEFPVLDTAMNMTVDDFLPIGATFDLKLLHKDLSVIAHLTADVSLNAA